MNGVSQSMKMMFLTGTMLAAFGAQAAGIPLPALQAADLTLPAESDAVAEPAPPPLPAITDVSGADDDKLFSFDEPVIDESGPSIFNALPEPAAPPAPDLPLPPPVGQAPGQVLSTPASPDPAAPILPSDAPPAGVSPEDSVEVFDIFNMPADPLPEPEPEPVILKEPALPDLPTPSAIQDEEEQAPAEPAKSSASPAPHTGPVISKPKHYRLPTKIYRKEYSRDNKHLPEARFEHEYDAQMFLAIGHDRVETVRSLLNTGRGVEMRNAEGDTPLLYAIRARAHNTARMLLGRGANPNASNDRGVSALHYAMLVDSPQMAAALLEMGADPNLPDLQGVTPLMLAASTGNPAFTQVLLQGHAEANLSSYDGRSPLHVAAEYNNATAAALLVQAGADVNARKLRGYTPLMSAAAAGADQVVTVLLNAGADVHAADDMGRSAADIARAYKHTALADRLLSAGIRRGYAVQPVQEVVATPLASW